MQITSFENKVERAQNHDKNYWRELIASWKNSNESQKDFCKRMNIKLGTFAHWRGVFTKENQKSENKFIGLQVISPTQAKANHFTIECPSGHKIIFSSDVNPAQTQQIFKCLGLIV